MLSRINQNINVHKLIDDFMGLVGAGEVEVYNEFSLQHELGIFLRANIAGYKIQFERNTKSFGIKGTVKHESEPMRRRPMAGRLKSTWNMRTG